MRVRVLRIIIERPLNANQLAKELCVDYSTVRHHLDLLIKNGVVEAVGDKYGAIFYVSKWLADKTGILNEILSRSGDEIGKK